MNIDTATPVENRTRPCAIDAQDALNVCKQCLGVLYCAIETSGSVDKEDVTDAIGLAVTQLHSNLQTVRDHFGMDRKEAAAS
jgi:hypothetical protein